MFSTAEQLAKRTGKNDADRQKFLEQLVNEFKTTQSLEAKEQVLANLANFCYDPINYEYIRLLKVIDIFLDQLSEDNPVLIEFALGGLCNLALDDEIRDYILHCNGVQIISSCLSSSNDETVISAITTLIFLVTSESKPSITTPEIVSWMLQFATHTNPRIRNLSTIFVEDYVGNELVSRMTNTQTVKDVESIPLPSE